MQRIATVYASESPERMSPMIKAHKIRLHPTPEQAVSFAKAAGVARFVWNWALAEWERQYQAGEKPTALKLKKQFNAARAIPLDVGRHEECFRSTLSGPLESLCRVF